MRDGSKSYRQRTTEPALPWARRSGSMPGGEPIVSAEPGVLEQPAACRQSGAHRTREKPTLSLRREENECARAVVNRCRGACLTAIADRAAIEGWQAFLDALAGEDASLAALFAQGDLGALRWYPIGSFCQAHAALREATGRGLEVARQVGLDSSQKDLKTGVFRVLLKLISPMFLLERAPSLFRSYIEYGRLDVRHLGDHEVELGFAGCAGFDAALFQDLLGGCEGALLAAGATNVRIDLLDGGGDNDEHALVRASWSE
jgi:uncharacterized protein (TIGR02265 family)